MLKRDELNNPDSCLSKADFEDMLFVFRSKDPVAAEAIRWWKNRRVELGINKAEDVKITSAEECAKIMEEQLLKINPHGVAAEIAYRSIVRAGAVITREQVLTLLQTHPLKKDDVVMTPKTEPEASKVVEYPGWFRGDQYTPKITGLYRVAKPESYQTEWGYNHYDGTKWNGFLDWACYTDMGLLFLWVGAGAGKDEPFLITRTT